MGPRPLANMVFIVLLTATLAFMAYLTVAMTREAAEGPSPPTAVSRGM